MGDISSKEKLRHVRTAYLCNKRNSTNANAQKLKKAQRELIQKKKKNKQKKRIPKRTNRIHARPDRLTIENFENDRQ